MYGRRGFLRPAIVAILLFLPLLSGGSACRLKGGKPDKISRLGVLSASPDGAKVEFASWVREVEGDNDLGIELYMTDSPNTYPQVFVELKDGQKPPKKDQEICVSGRIINRQNISGGTIFRIKDAEVIDCY
jgi:hypothetical protein